MPLIKRSISLSGHRTSLSLEPEFWAAIDQVITTQGQSLAGFINQVDSERGEEPLASSVRVWVLRRLMDEAGLSAHGSGNRSDAPHSSDHSLAD